MGGIDIKWLLIGGVVLLLLVAMGNNPVENAKREFEESKKGKDPLMESIREFNEKQSPAGDRTSSGSVDTRISNHSQPLWSDVAGQGSAYPETNVTPVMPSYMYRDGQQPSQPAEQPQNMGAGNGYYPPPPAQSYPAAR